MLLLSYFRIIPNKHGTLEHALLFLLFFLWLRILFALILVKILALKLDIEEYSKNCFPYVFIPAAS